MAAKRTPFGAYGGKLMKFTTVDLQVIAGRAALAAGNINPEIVDMVTIGNVIQVRIDICRICTKSPDVGLRVGYARHPVYLINLYIRSEIT